MLFDRRGDGKIESAQLGEILRSLGLNPTQADVKKALNEVDPTGTQVTSYSVIKTQAYSISKLLSYYQNVEESFDVQKATRRRRKSVYNWERTLFIFKIK